MAAWRSIATTEFSKDSDYPPHNRLIYVAYTFPREEKRRAPGRRSEPSVSA
jgi:hypothetical protein